MRRIHLVLALSAGLAASAGPGAAGTCEPFTAALTPPTTVALVDEVVEIAFEVDTSATGFNGYTVTLAYDPAIVSFEGVAEGALMTSACPQRFEDVATDPGSVSYTHVILCGGVSIEGPGVLSVFSFRTLALGQSSIEITSDPNCTFFDAGVCVGEIHPECPRTVSLSDAVVLVVDEITSAPETSGVPLTTLSLAPNPTPSGGTFAFRLGGGGRATLELFDVTGRRRIHRTLEVGAAGTIGWNGRGGDGAALPAGAYFARISRGDHAALARIVVTR